MKEIQDRHHDHVTPQLLSEVADRSVGLAELFLRVYNHLLEVCPECARAVQTFEDERAASFRCQGGGPSVEEQEARRDPVGLRARVAAEERRLESMIPQAREEIEELLSQDRDRRMDSLRRQPLANRKRFANPVLVNLLLEKSRQQLGVDLEEAEALVELAGEVVNRLPTERTTRSLVTDLRTRVLAYRANVRRALQDLPQAEQWMGEALQACAEISDPLLEAEVHDLAGVLWKDLRRFDASRVDLDRAAAIYLRVGEDHLLGRNWLYRALLYEVQGDLDESIEALRHAVDLLDPARDAHAQLCAGHNLAWFLTNLERYGEAAEVYRRHRARYEDFPGVRIQLRRRWLEGRIAFGTGCPDEAEALLTEVRRGFLDRNLRYDAAVASLDLARLYATQGRHGELRELAGEMVAAFRAHGIHRETLAALGIFQQAAAAEAVTQGMIRELAAYLETSRSRPALRFEPVCGPAEMD
jgi:tetratricopeptide (TPR) repeat protein